jgi:hypothetical protein
LYFKPTQREGIMTINFDRVNGMNAPELRAFLLSDDVKPYLPEDAHITTKTKKADLYALADDAKQEYENTQRMNERDNQVTPIEQDSYDRVMREEEAKTSEWASADRAREAADALHRKLQLGTNPSDPTGRIIHKQAARGKAPAMATHYKGRATGAKHLTRGKAYKLKLRADQRNYLKAAGLNYAAYRPTLNDDLGEAFADYLGNL